MEKIAIVYQSRTGFARDYARALAARLGCPAYSLREARPEQLANCRTLVFGGRIVGGRIEGLKRARALLKRSGAQRFAVFATGATPVEDAEMQEALWRGNLSDEERAQVAHFYLPGGLRRAALPPGERLMLKLMVRMLRDAPGRDGEMARLASQDSELYDEAQLEPLLRWLEG